MTNIRPATEQDVQAIVDMSSSFYATTTYTALAPMCAETVGALVRMLIDTGIMLVALDAGRYVGMVGLCVAPFMFNNAERVAHEVVWWVDPNHQGKGLGMQLLIAAEEEARAAGCVAAQMLHLSTSPPQAAALYERLGYHLSETSYLKEIR